MTEGMELKESPDTSPSRRPAGAATASGLGPDAGGGHLYVRTIEPPLQDESERQSIGSLQTAAESDPSSDACVLRSEMRPLIVAGAAPPSAAADECSSSSESGSESDASDELDDDGPLAVTTSAAFARFAAPAAAAVPAPLPQLVAAPQSPVGSSRNSEKRSSVEYTSGQLLLQATQEAERSAATVARVAPVISSAAQNAEPFAAIPIPEDTSSTINSINSSTSNQQVMSSFFLQFRNIILQNKLRKTLRTCLFTLI